MPPDAPRPAGDAAGATPADADAAVGVLDPAQSDRAPETEEEAAARIARQRRHARATRRRRKAHATFWTYVGLAAGSLIVLFPLYVLVIDSLLSPSQLALNPPTFFPTHPAWGNFVKVFTEWDFGHDLVVSGIQTSVIVVAQLVTSILAAYAFVFLRFPLRRTLFLVVLATVMIPLEVTFAANFQIVRDLGWQGNYLGLVAPFLATGFGIFLLRQAFLQIPRELQEAAIIDGYGPLRFMWRVAIPLARPVIAALAVFSFLGAWNQYLWPSLIANQNQSLKTVTIGVASIAGSTDTAGIYLASGVVSLAPLLILLLFFRKNLIRSLTAGAVK